MEELEDVVLKSMRSSTESSVWRDLACMPNCKEQIHRSREQDGLPKDAGGGGGGRRWYNLAILARQRNKVV